MFAFKSLVAMLVMVSVMTASMSNAEVVVAHPTLPEDVGKLTKNETSKPIIPPKEIVQPVQEPTAAEVPFRSKEEKQKAHDRRLVHYVLHSALEVGLEDLLDFGFDETMVTHEDVASLQKCIGKPAMKHLTTCLTNEEEREKANKDKHEEEPKPIFDAAKNGTHIPAIMEKKDNFVDPKEVELEMFLHPVVMQCLTKVESKRVSLCFEDQTFKIIEDNLDLIEELEEYGSDPTNLNKLDELEDLEELEELEKLKELDELKEIEHGHHGHHHHHHHHGGDAHHHHHHHKDHHHHQHKFDKEELEEKKLKELELLDTGLKPTKSTLPAVEHLRRDELKSADNGHMVLEKRKFGYGPDWATLVGKRDVHPLP